MFRKESVFFKYITVIEMKKFPSYKQLDPKDCGPTCLKIIARYYGKYIDIQDIREKCGVNRSGVSFFDLGIAAENLGFKSIAYNLNVTELLRIDLPCVLHVKGNHFTVAYKISPKKVCVSDPAHGLIYYDLQEFKDIWLGKKDRGPVLALEARPEFYSEKGGIKKRTSYLSAFLNYLVPYRSNIIHLMVVMLIVSIAQAFLPFITKSIIDIGVDKHDMNFVKLIVIGQGIILLSILLSNALRNWILTHVTSRINVSMLSNYIIKLMNLPLSYFETRTIGDTLQRASDHERIQNFIVNSSISIIFSFLTFVIYIFVLFFFDVHLFLILLLGIILFTIWAIIFQRARKLLDVRYFELSAKNRGNWIEILSTMPDIKLNNYDKKKRWGWEAIQAGLYKINLKLLSINQTQDLGGQFILNITNLVLTYYSAKSAINGELTLGTMLSIQYMVGQINGPLLQLVPFLRSAQFADFSFQRLNEIQNLPDEESVGASGIFNPLQSRSITLKNVFFKYGANESPVLKGLNFVIPDGKITAIVGQSGSGKTTLLKLLMGLYYPSHGEILIGETPLNTIKPRTWRSQFGAVLQEGKIFNDTVVNNIVLDTENIDFEWLEKILEIASIKNTINQLPQRLNALLGEEGIELSHGQKQRILIARALYKNPSLLFMDEATNSLDSTNENAIVNQLDQVFENKTVIIAAHRLSTIQRAKQIIVLQNGMIAEIGSHDFLVKKKGVYYSLFQGQFAINE